MQAIKNFLFLLFIVVCSITTVNASHKIKRPSASVFSTSMVWPDMLVNTSPGLVAQRPLQEHGGRRFIAGVGGGDVHRWIGQGRVRLVSFCDCRRSRSSWDRAYPGLPCSTARVVRPGLAWVASASRPLPEPPHRSQSPAFRRPPPH